MAGVGMVASSIIYAIKVQCPCLEEDQFIKKISIPEYQNDQTSWQAARQHKEMVKKIVKEHKNCVGNFYILFESRGK